MRVDPYTLNRMHVLPVPPYLVRKMLVGPGSSYFAGWKHANLPLELVDKVSTGLDLRCYPTTVQSPLVDAENLGHALQKPIEDLGKENCVERSQQISPGYHGVGFGLYRHQSISGAYG
jgi:hypothetical protein